MHGNYLLRLKSREVSCRLSDRDIFSQNWQNRQERRRSDIATRKTVFVGTNQYPDPAEKFLHSVDTKESIQGKDDSADDVVDPITLFRGSEEYEKIRIAVGKASKEPVVFLLTLEIRQ